MLERIGGGAWKLKEPEEVPGLYEENEELPVFDEARTWLDGYFLGRDPGFLPSLSRRAVRSANGMEDIM